MAARPITILLTIFVASLLFSSHAYAQFANVAYTYTVTDKDAVEGDLLSIGDKSDQLIRTTIRNQDALFGVIAKEPIIVFRTGTDKTPIVRAGETIVGVTTANGAIKRGDLLVTSALPGKAQKFIRGTNGKLVGNALDDFSEKEGTPLRTDASQGQAKDIYVGKVQVALNIAGSIDQTPTIGALLQSLIGTFLGKGSLSKDTELILRFFIAAIIASCSIVISYRSFGKNIAKGIEAMGRNPLARVQIQSMMILNVLLTLGISVLGIFLAIVIIKF